MPKVLITFSLVYRCDIGTLLTSRTSVRVVHCTYTSYANQLLFEHEISLMRSESAAPAWSESTPLDGTGYGEARAGGGSRGRGHQHGGGQLRTARHTGAVSPKSHQVAVQAKSEQKSL